MAFCVPHFGADVKLILQLINCTPLRQTGRAPSDGVGEPVHTETGIPEGIPTAAAHRGRDDTTDKKIPPVAAVIHHTLPSRQTRAPFSWGLFKIVGGYFGVKL